MPLSHFINNSWVSSDAYSFQSTDPATDTLLWSGSNASRQTVVDAYTAAAKAFPDWAGLSLDKRLSYLEAFRTCLEKKQPQMAEVISLETGKP